MKSPDTKLIAASITERGCKNPLDSIECKVTFSKGFSPDVGDICRLGVVASIPTRSRSAYIAGFEMCLGAVKVACDADPDYKARVLAYLRGDDE